MEFELTVLAKSSTCPRCGGVLNVIGARVWEPKGRGIARYSRMIPVVNARIGEAIGGTPVEEIEMRGKRLVLKHEHLNLSGSFKDRGTALALSLAFLGGAKEVAEDSSGNTAIAVALLGKRMGLRTTLFVPRDAPRGKLKLMQLLGAKIVPCESRAKATDEVKKYVSNNPSVYYVDHLRNPLFVEGPRTIAYEVFEQVGSVGTVIAPVGSGGLLLGLVNGWIDLLELGLVKKLPKFVAVQGVEVAPLYERMYGSKPSGGSSKLADGIRVANPPRLNGMIETLRKVRGEVVLVSDRDIVEALRELIDMGIIVEPTSATVLAALNKMLRSGKDLEEPILLVLTGSGLKMVDELREVLQASF